MVEKIVEIGFKSYGFWSMDGAGIRANLENPLSELSILYAFSADGELCYIGKTIQGLVKRLNGYRNPSPSQSTNIRVNALIKVALDSGKKVGIYAWGGNDLLKYGEFTINLAAGLEDSMIEVLKPEWNVR
ncbi:MAG: GIY-YIG nuclease family protein [Planctomycetota bacterium]|nr:GIY-YIG nuclease family protein [Planctomycetota bacterium]